MAQGVNGNDATDGADAVRGVADFLVRIQNEICRVNDFSPLFPKRSDFVGVARHFEAISYWISKLKLVDGFPGFIERIDGQSDDADVCFFELFDMRLEVGQLPKAVGSPDAAIKYQNRILSG